MDEERLGAAYYETELLYKREEVDYGEMNSKLIRDIKDYVGQESDGKKCKTVAFIGTAGVGKSSFINSTAAAFSRKCWRQYAFPGHYGGGYKQVTYHVDSFPKDTYCDMTEYKDYCMPTLVDIAGFENIPSEIIEEVLRIIFFGRIPDGTSLKTVHEYGNKHGLQKLREKFIAAEDGRKIDVVVFVSSAMESAIPCHLIENVLNAARPTGAKDTKGKRVIPIFGILTNIDKINVTDTSFLDKELEFKNALALDNNRYMRCENYSDEVDTKYNIDRTEQVLNKLDRPILKFMKQVCDPVIKVLRTEEDFDSAMSAVMNNVDKTAVFLNKYKHYIKENQKRVWFTNSWIISNSAKFLFIALFLFFILLLSSSIDGAQLAAACAEYKETAKKCQMEITYFNSLCENQNQLIFACRYCFWFSVVLAALVVGFDFYFPEIIKACLEYYRLQMS